MSAMRWAVLILAVTWACVCWPVRTVVASSGAPAVVLDATLAPPNPANPALTRMTLDSGNLGTGSEERWTAFQFVISSDNTTLDGIEINYTEQPALTPSLYGAAIYTDNAGSPGSVIDQWLGSYYFLAQTATTRTYANTFVVDRCATVPLPLPITLNRGTYWAAVYGVDGNIPQYSGAPGGSTNNYAHRKSSVGSSYAHYETKSYCMPAFRMHIDEGYLGLGSGPPYNYSGWSSNEQQGRDIYHLAYSIVDSSGASGTTVTGTLSAEAWPEPPWLYFPGDDSKLQAFDVCFADPSSEQVQIVQTVNLDSTGRFVTEQVRNGTYDILVFPRHWYIDRFTCSDGIDDYGQPEVSGMGHPFIPVRLTGVTLNGGTKDIGQVTMASGDLDLSSTTGLADLATVLAGFDASVVGMCPPPWTNYRLTFDCDGSGTIGLPDLSTVLLNFLTSGPSR